VGFNSAFKGLINMTVAHVHLLLLSSLPVISGILDAFESDYSVWMITSSSVI
jgi:hypothetical protein